ncbi:transcriptional regulator, partial [Bacillus cereus]
MEASSMNDINPVELTKGLPGIPC